MMFHPNMRQTLSRVLLAWALIPLLTVGAWAAPEEPFAVNSYVCYTNDYSKSDCYFNLAFTGGAFDFTHRWDQAHYGPSVGFCTKDYGTSTHNRIQLPGGELVDVKDMREGTLAVSNSRVSPENGGSVSYEFSFECTFQTVADSSVTSGDGWTITGPVERPSITIRGSGQTRGFVPFAALRTPAVDDPDTFCLRIGSMECIDAAYEINAGDGWQPLELYSCANHPQWPSGAPTDGAMFLCDKFILPFSGVISAPVTPEPAAEPEVVAVTAAAAAVTAAVAGAAGAAVSATSSSAAAAAGETLTDLGTGAVSDLSSQAPPEQPAEPDSAGSGFSLLVNGGAPLMALCSTAKATVEVPVVVEGGEALDWNWAAVCLVPDAPRAAVGSVVGFDGSSATASVMLTGSKLPRQSLPVFLELTAFAELDGEPITLTSVSEFTLYEKGLSATLNDASQPLAAESYTVKFVSDSNLDGIAEITTLTSDAYTISEAEDLTGAPCIRITAAPPYPGMVEIPLPG